MKRKVIAGVLIFAMLFSLVPTAALADDAVTVTNSYTSTADGLTWVLTSDGTLTISGDGPMNDTYSSTAYDVFQENARKLVIQPGVTSVGQAAFHNYTALEEVELPNTITKIESMAFQYCYNIEEFVIPESVETIYNHALNGLDKIERIRIPAKVSEFGGKNNSDSLKEYIVDSGNEHFIAVDGVLYSKDMTRLQSYPGGKTGDTYVAPETVTTIPDYALCDAPVKTIYFSQNVNYVGNHGIPSVNENFQGVYFYGDAPDAFSNAFLNETATLYYIEGKNGWTTPKWNGYNTAAWAGGDHYQGGTDGDGSGEQTPDNPGVTETAIVGTKPVDGATNVGYDASHLPEFHIEFNKIAATKNGAGVQVDATKEPFAIYRASDDKLIWEDPAHLYKDTGFSTRIVKNENGKIITISPTNNHSILEKNTEYYITMGEGYIKFEDGTTSPAIKEGDWKFRTKNPDEMIMQVVTMKTGDADHPNADVSVTWKDSWFDNSSNYYMHDLATASMALSGAAYVETDGVPDIISINSALQGFGFSWEKVGSYYYGVERTKTDNDMVSFTFASKTVEDNGKPYELVAIVVKGTSSDEEWYSNFNIGTDGSYHEGFQTAANKLMASLDGYLKEYNLENENLKFLVTGHSRGAAVANIVAKELTSGGYAPARDIYGYTFATPTVTTDSKASQYNNIFNIISGEDFVTRVPLSNWGFKHYGVDLLLPSRSYYGSGYDEVYDKMNGKHVVMVAKDHVSYDGTQSVDKVLSSVYKLAPTVKQFYTAKHDISGTGVINNTTLDDYFQIIAGVLVGDANASNLIQLLLSSNQSDFAGVTWFFVSDHVLNPRIFGAHAMSTYYSWMSACTAEELFGSANGGTSYWFKRAIIACPVNVYIYNEAGKLVASVVNETIGENILAVSVEDGVKTIDLPGDQEYSIEIVATGEGTVDYTVEEYFATAIGDDKQRTVEFNDIAISNGDELTTSIDNTNGTRTERYVVTIKDSETQSSTAIYADYDSKLSTNTGGGFSGIYNYPVTVADTDGAAVKVSEEHAIEGEKVTITVTPESGKQVDEIIVTDEDGEVIAVSKVGDNTYTFTMPKGKVNVAVTTEAIDYDTKVVLQIGNKNVVVDGKPFANDVAPLLQGDRTLVPIRVIIEALGGEVDWNEATRTVTITIDGKVLTLVIDEPIPSFGQGAAIINNRTYVPVRYVAEYVGANVEWIAETQQIVILK